MSSSNELTVFHGSYPKDLPAELPPVGSRFNDPANGVYILTSTGWTLLGTATGFKIGTGFELGEVGLEERDVVALLRPYVNFREDERIAKGAKERTGETLKSWLLEHGGVKSGLLHDGEAHITGKLIERSSKTALDLETIFNNDKPLLRELIRLGVLELNVGKLDESGLRPRVEPHILPALMTPVLDVREDKR